MSDSRNPLIEYICSRFAQEDDLLERILRDQQAGGGPMMNIGPDQGKFLDLLVRIHKPRTVLEVGSYYGYSSVWLARALSSLRGVQQPPSVILRSTEGATSGSIPKLHCVEISEKQCEIIRGYMQDAGLSDLVQIHQGSGIDLMNKFIKDSMSFDMIFVDADKANYSNYLDLAYQLLPSGGLLLVDNCLWNGQVADPSYNDSQTQSIREFNDKLAAHHGFESLIVTIQDGLAVAVKK